MLANVENREVVYAVVSRLASVFSTKNIGIMGNISVELCDPGSPLVTPSNSATNYPHELSPWRELMWSSSEPKEDKESQSKYADYFCKL